MAVSCRIGCMNDPAFQFDPTDYIEAGMASVERRLAFPGSHTSVEAMTRWQAEVRRETAAVIRLPENAHAPTRPQTLWRRETELGVIEKVVFHAEEGADVPAYALRPV